MNPEPMTRVPSSRRGASRAPNSSSWADLWVGMDSWSTGMSASGNMAISGSQAPWSRPRLGCWWTGSSWGIIAATRRARALASGVS